MAKSEWDGHIIQYTDMQGVAAASIHFSGGTAMSRLEAEMAKYFDGSGAKIRYGGSTVGNEVKVVQITLKPGVKIKENDDGTITISVINAKEGTTAVVKLDRDGKVVEGKTTKVEYTADGGAFQRITDQDGNVRDVTLVHGGEGKSKPQVFIDHDTGQLTAVSVTSKEEHTKTVATFREDGGLINRIDYDYDILEDGRVVEYSVDMNGKQSTREVISLIEAGQVSSIEMLSGGWVFASSTMPNGNQVYVDLSKSSARADVGWSLFEIGSDGSVIRRYVKADGTVLSEFVLIEAAEGSDRPTMEVCPTGSVIFKVTRADGTQINVALDSWGLEFSGGTRTYELGRNGSAVLKYYDNQTDTTVSRTLIEAKEGAGIPVLERDQYTGEFRIRAFQADGSEIVVQMDEAGWAETDKYRLSLEQVGGELHQFYESLMYNDELSFGRMRIRTDNWHHFIGTNPDEVDTSRPDVIHGQGGVRDAWDRVLDWSLNGVPVLGEKIQTIGDADWEGWKENGGTVDRQSVDFTGTGDHKGVHKALRLKAGGAGHDVMQGTDGLDVFYGGAGRDTLSGGGDSDLLSGEDDNDVLDGGDGKDALHGGHGDDTIYGGAGDDLLDDGLAGTKDGVNVTGNDYMDGGDGNDRIEGRLGNDTLIGGEGSDSLLGGDGDDRLDGGEGKDFLSGGRGADTLLGGAGDDRLFGNDGNDVLDGGEGNDVLDGWSGDDVANGGNGNDIILGSLGADTLNGGAGIDTVDYSKSSSWIHVDLASGFSAGGSGSAAQDDRLIGVENVVGSAHNDTIIVGNTSGQYFDFGDYLARNGDVAAHIAANGLDRSWAYHHWLTWGRFEGRAGGWSGGSQSGADWGSAFDVAGYLAANADVAAYKKAHNLSDAWVWEHWLTIGAPQGRAGAFKVSGSVIDAGAGHDTVQGGVYSDYLIGGAGNDALVGHQGHDILVGGEGDDTLRGGDGDDHVYGGAGNDVIDDMISTGYVYGHDKFDGGDGNDKLFGRFGDDTLYGGTGDDYLDGGEDNDHLDGGDGHDALIGYTGNDVIYGRFGNDWLSGGAGNDHLDAGEDNDYVEGGEGHDYIIGWTGNDTLIGGDGQDTLLGGDGDDWLYGQWGDDVVYGQGGNDVLIGDYGNDTLDGGEGHDELHGQWGDDRLSGGLGNDYLTGGSGFDTIYGGANEDQLHGEDGNDLLQGEDGYDVLFGGSGNDWMSGGAHNDTLYGGWNEDTVFGGDGHDMLFGEDGYDVLNGGAGNDTLWGGAHSDQFVFDAGGGSDVVKDFGRGDVIRLTSVSKSDWWLNYNSPKTLTNWGTLIGTEITIGDRKILIEGIKAEQLKGGAVSGGAWEWYV